MTHFKQSTRSQLPAYQYDYGNKTVSGVCLQNTFDYSPFGAALDGRTIESDFYRRGFNGMEKDDEVKGSGNSYDFGARMYDSRVGRWLTIDKKAREYPMDSPYGFVSNSPLKLNDPTGESGEVTIDKAAGTVTVSAHMIFYGNSANSAVASQSAKDVQDLWNAANGKVMIDGVQYTVKFSITAEYKPGLTPNEMAMNTDIKNNYIRVEEENSKGISNFQESGNSGYFLIRNIKNDGSTTEGHEMGHGWGLDRSKYGTADGHPADRDLRGEGQPGIMISRGVFVDPQFQYDPNAAAGAKGGTVNPEKRKVLQSDIDDLGLDKLVFDSNGKANLGKLTNNYRKDETPAPVKH